jgi:uncharacterized protein
MPDKPGVKNAVGPPRRKRLLRRFVILVAGLFVVGLFGSWVVGGALVSPCPCVIEEPPAGLPAEPISLVSESGGTIAGWYVPAEPSQGVVVLLHPIRGSRLFMLDRARLLHSAGYSLVMIDFQAHGESPGANVTIGYLEKFDARAAVDFARRTHPNEPIGVVGVSLGGASALLALPLDIDALVLESVYPNIRNAVFNRVAERLGPLAALPAQLLLVQLKPRLGISAEELRPSDHLAEIGCPVFFLSGTEDRHTTVLETRQMFSAAAEPKELWLVDGAAHEDLYQAAPQEYQSRILGFLNRHMRKPL